MENRSRKFRMWETIFFGLILVLASLYTDPLTAWGVLVQGLAQLAKALISVGVFYWVLRGVLHERTHECKDPEIRGNYLVIGYALVFSAVLILG